VRRWKAYGNALLTRFPVLDVHRHNLSVTWREPRGAIDVTLDMARPHASVVAAVEGHGLSQTARAFSLVATGDWVTYHAALARGVDPTPVDAIAALKQALHE